MVATLRMLGAEIAVTSPMENYSRTNPQAPLGVGGAGGGGVKKMLLVFHLNNTNVLDCFNIEPKTGFESGGQRVCVGIP